METMVLVVQPYCVSTGLHTYICTTMYLYTFLWAPKLRNMTKSCQMEVLPQDSEVYSLFRAGGTHDGVIGVIPIFARIIGKNITLLRYHQNYTDPSGLGTLKIVAVFTPTAPKENKTCTEQEILRCL